MTLREIADLLDAKVLCGDERLDNVVVEYVAAADMMSDVLAFGQPGFLLVTGLNTPQVPRTVNIVGGIGVVVVRKPVVLESTVELAQVLEVPLLHSPLTMFEACGKLYARGLKPINVRVKA